LGNAILLSFPFPQLQRDETRLQIRLVAFPRYGITPRGKRQ
jgi:hypothetical protein